MNNKIKYIDKKKNLDNILLKNDIDIEDLIFLNTTNKELENIFLSEKNNLRNLKHKIVYNKFNKFSTHLVLDHNFNKEFKKEFDEIENHFNKIKNNNNDSFFDLNFIYEKNKYNKYLFTNS